MSPAPASIGSLEIAALTAGYRDGSFTPLDVIDAVYSRIAARGDDATFISLLSKAEASALARGLGPFDASKPLWGIPCAVKDNIDAAGFATTLACAEAAYTPTHDAPAVAGLRAAGALVLGKTNLDQFATGLNGTRSPFGVPTSAFGGGLIPGGSSSGSGVAVAAGLVSFALGTDTAGSGRVPAALGSVVGLKPSRGMISARGVYPACASLDCVSVFALTVDDAALVASCIAGEDQNDPYSRALPRISADVRAIALAGRRIAVPAGMRTEFFGDTDFGAAWERVLDTLACVGVEVVPIPMEAFYEAGAMLYGGAWLAERHAALTPMLAANPDAVEPVVRAIVEPGADVNGADVFVSMSHLARLRRATRSQLASVDALMTPTVGGVFSVDQMLAEPIAHNAKLGRFTTFTNLLDLAAVAVPAALVGAVPFGVSLQAPARGDNALISLAAALADTLAAPLGATGWAPTPRTRADAGAGESMSVAVVGAHLRGQPLHNQLLDVGATFERTDRTASAYRLYALTGTVPPKPGLVPSPTGSPIEVEIYTMTPAGVGHLLAKVPAPLGLGRIVLEGGDSCLGFVCTDATGAADITEFGGWRAYLAATVNP